MFNLLVSADSTAWESGQRMTMHTSRFKEYSGDEAEKISLDKPETLKRLEAVQSMLMYESGIDDPPGETVRIGRMMDVKAGSGSISFRFKESGRTTRKWILENDHRLQMGSWEHSRTHWAIKDGEIPQDVLEKMVAATEQYDIVLSYAGENRAYVEAVATFLEVHAVSVFYDRNEQATLWGKELPEHFDLVFRKLGRFCVMFISEHYAQKVWTSHERKSALARAVEQRTEYLLPARFDKTDIPGLRPTIGYVDLSTMKPEQLGELILQKLGRNSA